MPPTPLMTPTMTPTTTVISISLRHFTDVAVSWWVIITAGVRWKVSPLIVQCTSQCHCVLISRSIVGLCASPVNNCQGLNAASHVPLPVVDIIASHNCCEACSPSPITGSWNRTNMSFRICGCLKNVLEFKSQNTFINWYIFLISLIITENVKHMSYIMIFCIYLIPVSQHSHTVGRYWAAKASLISIRSKSSNFMPLRLKRSATAGTGDSPIMDGWQPPLPVAAIFASGWILRSLAFSADMMTMAADPSFMPLELPAVTLPISGTNAGGSFWRSAGVSPGLKC